MSPDEHRAFLASLRPPRRLTGHLVLHGWNLSETVECKVVDARGERTLVARPSGSGARRAEFDGDPGLAILRTEALSGIRLTDGADWNLFICTWDSWPKMRDPTSPVTFADYYDRLYPGTIERTVTESNTPKQAAQSPSRHSADFRSVLWHGTNFSFTKMQAGIVKVLWEARDGGTPDVGAETLLEAVDAKASRLVDVFRDNSAWGTFIVDGSTKGAKRIADPPNP